jgi:hypothetical protein
LRHSILQWFPGHGTKGTSNKRTKYQAGLHKNFKICVSKGNINRVKRQLSEWNKIFSRHISDKNRELLRSTMKNKQLSSKMGKMCISPKKIFK